MKLKVDIYRFGYCAKGYKNYFEINIDEGAIIGMTEEEKEEYIQRCIHEYILDGLEYEYEIEE